MSISTLSWNKVGFLSKCKLCIDSHRREQKKIASSDRKERAAGYSALSSTYYSVAGTAVAQLRATLRPRWLLWLLPLRVALWSITWLPLGLWCYARMLPLSNEAVAAAGWHTMTADQCDVRQSILRKRGKYSEARKWIQYGLNKNPSTHTEGLLGAGLAEVLLRKGYPESEIMWAVDGALRCAAAIPSGEPQQKARILRQCAAIVHSFDPAHAKNLLEEAQHLAKECGARDQVLKTQ